MPAGPRRSPPGAPTRGPWPGPKVGASRAVDFLRKRRRGERGELAEEEGKEGGVGPCLPWRKRKETWKEEAGRARGYWKK